MSGLLSGYKISHMFCCVFYRQISANSKKKCLATFVPLATFFPDLVYAALLFLKILKKEVYKLLQLFKNY